MSAIRNLLAGQRDLNAVRAALVPFENFHRYPSATNRAAWDNLPAATRTRFLADGENQLSAPWEPLLASVLLDYPRHGNRETYQQPYSRRRGRLQEPLLNADAPSLSPECSTDPIWHSSSSRIVNTEKVR